MREREKRGNGVGSILPTSISGIAMTIKCPPLYSVWENDKGRKLFVEEVYDEADDREVELEEGDEPQFFVTVVPYAERNDVGSISEELDAEQWADLIKTDGMRQTGIESPARFL